MFRKRDAGCVILSKKLIIISYPDAKQNRFDAFWMERLLLNKTAAVNVDGTAVPWDLMVFNGSVSHSKSLVVSVNAPPQQQAGLFYLMRNYFQAGVWGGLLDACPFFLKNSIGSFFEIFYDFSMIFLPLSFSKGFFSPEKTKLEFTNRSVSPYLVWNSYFSTL